MSICGRRHLVGLLLSIGLVVLSGCGPSLPRRVELYAEDGVHLYRCGAYADARESFELAARHRPGDPTLLYNLAQCNAHLGEKKKAEDLYRDCIRRVPNHVEARHALNGLLVSQGRAREAERLTDDWIEREPANASAYAEQGWLIRQTGDLPKAEARLQQALQLEPANVHALIRMGEIHELYSQPDRALDLYTRALAAQPNHPELPSRIERLQADQVGRPRPDR